MKTQPWLSPAATRRGRHSKQSTRVLATRGIFAAALAFGSLGAVGAALSAHDGAGHANIHQTPGHASLSVVTTPANSVRMAPMAWML